MAVPEGYAGILPLFLFLAGLAVGSFLNVVVQRLPRGESVLAPRSRCPVCAAPIRPGDNLPVVSFVVLGGRCRACRTRIPLRYPVMELLTGVLFATAPTGEGWTSLLTWILFGSLVLTLAATDLERFILPDALTLPGALAGLALAGPRPDLDLAASALGALLGAGLLLFVRWVWLRVRRVEALGQGDIKMMLLIGAFLGPAATLHAVVLASAAGLLIAGPLLLWERISRSTPLPFGTLLAVGAAIRFVLPPGLLPGSG